MQHEPDGRDEDKPGALPEQVNEDLGGVQGEGPGDDGDDALAGTQSGSRPGAPDDAPAPDAGEIEWAGQVVKKPPTPT